jgi:hypothetical protein
LSTPFPKVLTVIYTLEIGAGGEFTEMKSECFMKLLHCFSLFVVLSWTLGVYATPLAPPAQTVPAARGYFGSQETVNALQMQRIEQLEVRANAAADNINSLQNEIITLRSSIDTFTGMGIGVGGTLTILQIVQVIMAFRGRKQP